MQAADLDGVVQELGRNDEAAKELYASVQAAGAAVVREKGWDAAQHFEHLALFNRAYLSAMTDAAEKGRRNGRVGQGAIRPSLVGGLFVQMTEPPVRRWARWGAPAAVQPEGLPLGRAFDDFRESHERVILFCRENREADLSGIRFVNPLVKGMNFSLATCLLLIGAHERRHFWEIGQG